MEKPEPNENVLKSIYLSPKANSGQQRLQIAHIFK
jgi:hypothetical protein